MVLRVRVALGIDHLLPLAEAPQGVVRVVRDLQVFLMVRMQHSGLGPHMGKGFRWHAVRPQTQVWPQTASTGCQAGGLGQPTPIPGCGAGISHLLLFQKNQAHDGDMNGIPNAGVMV